VWVQVQDLYGKFGVRTSFFTKYIEFLMSEPFLKFSVVVNSSVNYKCI